MGWQSKTHRKMFFEAGFKTLNSGKIVHTQDKKNKTRTSDYKDLSLLLQSLPHSESQD